MNWGNSFFHRNYCTRKFEIQVDRMWNWQLTQDHDFFRTISFINYVPTLHDFASFVFLRFTIRMTWALFMLLV